MGGWGGWGGTDVPAGPMKVFQLWNGLDSSDSIAGTAVQPTYNVRDEIRRRWDNSPYAMAVVEDPNPELDDAKARYDAFDTLVIALNPQDDWASFLTAAEDTFDSTFDFVSEVTDFVTAQETARAPEVMRAQAKSEASVGATTCVSTSQFWSVGAMLQAQSLRESAELRAKLALERKQRRQTLIDNAVTVMANLLQHKLEAHRVAVDMAYDHAIKTISLNNEATMNQLTIDKSADLWNFALMDKVSSVNEISGVAPLHEGTPWVVTAAQLHTQRQGIRSSNIIQGAQVGTNLVTGVLGGASSALGSGVGALGSLIPLLGAL